MQAPAQPEILLCCRTEVHRAPPVSEPLSLPVLPGKRLVLLFDNMECLETRRHSSPLKPQALALLDDWGTYTFILLAKEVARACELNPGLRIAFALNQMDGAEHLPLVDDAPSFFKGVSLTLFPVPPISLPHSHQVLSVLQHYLGHRKTPDVAFDSLAEQLVGPPRILQQFFVLVRPLVDGPLTGAEVETALLELEDMHHTEIIQTLSLRSPWKRPLLRALSEVWPKIKGTREPEREAASCFSLPTPPPPGWDMVERSGLLKGRKNKGDGQIILVYHFLATLLQSIKGTPF